nr:hypothetical protein [Butyrivibrio sp. WCE2006]
MYGTIWALMPPVIAIILALITKEVYTSLFAGIVVGALLSCSFNPVMAMNLIVKDGLSDAAAYLSGNFCFLVLLGCLLGIIRRAGGSRAFGRWAMEKLKTKKSAQLALRERCAGITVHQSQIPRSVLCRCQGKTCGSCFNTDTLRSCGGVNMFCNLSFFRYCEELGYLSFDGNCHDAGCSCGYPYNFGKRLRI